MSGTLSVLLGLWGLSCAIALLPQLSPSGHEMGWAAVETVEERGLTTYTGPTLGGAPMSDCGAPEDDACGRSVAAAWCATLGAVGHTGYEVDSTSELSGVSVNMWNAFSPCTKCSSMKMITCFIGDGQNWTTVDGLPGFFSGAFDEWHFNGTEDGSGPLVTVWDCRFECAKRADCSGFAFRASGAFQGCRLVAGPLSDWKADPSATTYLRLPDPNACPGGGACAAETVTSMALINTTMQFTLSFNTTLLLNSETAATCVPACEANAACIYACTDCLSVPCMQAATPPTYPTPTFDLAFVAQYFKHHAVPSNFTRMPQEGYFAVGREGTTQQIQTSSKPACQAQCEALATCSGYTFEERVSNCKLFDAHIQEFHPEAGYESALRQPDLSVCPPAILNKTIGSKCARALPAYGLNTSYPDAATTVVIYGVDEDECGIECVAREDCLYGFLNEAETRGEGRCILSLGEKPASSEPVERPAQVFAYHSLKPEDNFLRERKGGRLVLIRYRGTWDPRGITYVIRVGQHPMSACVAAPVNASSCDCKDVGALICPVLGHSSNADCYNEVKPDPSKVWAWQDEQLYDCDAGSCINLNRLLCITN